MCSDIRVLCGVVDALLPKLLIKLHILFAGPFAVMTRPCDFRRGTGIDRADLSRQSYKCTGYLGISRLTHTLVPVTALRVSCAGVLYGFVALAALMGSAVAAQSGQYGVVFGTGYNATTQYFNKNSSVTYTDGSCTDFFTIVLGFAAQNSTGPVGSISYQDLESGDVLAKTELTPQGSIFTGGPSYSIANATKLKTWRLPQTYSKVLLC